MKIPILGKFLVLGAILSVGLFACGNSFAQVSTTPNFNFKLVALDAQTKGNITINTTQVSFAILTTNNTANTYVVTLNPTLETVVDLPQDTNNAGGDFEPISQPTGLPTLTIPPFSTQTTLIYSSPTYNTYLVKLHYATPANHSLMGTVIFNLSYNLQGSTTKTTLQNLLATDVIYKR